jgi:predicted Zn-dependent peptidase
VLADLMTQGTKSRTREQIAEEIDSLGARLNAYSGRQAISVEMEFLAKDVDKAFAILGDVLKNPSFPEDELQRLVARRMDRVKAAKDQPQAAVVQHYLAYFYGKEHPYGRPAGGDETTLPKLTRAAIESAYKQQFAGKNMIVTVAGDFEAAAMQQKIQALVGALPAGEAYAWKKGAAVKASSASRLLLVDKPDATQTYFIIGQPGIERTNSDRTAIELVNTLFGGRFTSMLNDALRVDSGLTYGARSTVEMDRLPGSIYISTFTKNESTEQAIDLAIKQIEKLRRQGINAEQLASAKAYVKGLYPTQQLETSDQLADVLTDLELFGLNRGEIDDFISRVDSVTVEQANAVAKKYYRDQGLVFVLVGKAADIRKTAGKYAKDVVEIPITKIGFGQ